MAIIRHLQPSPHNIVPVFGDWDQILLVRKYERIRNGLSPVDIFRDWDIERRSGYEFQTITIQCPFCFQPHTIVIDCEQTSLDMENTVFFNDTNYCDYCQTEFIVNPKSEFEILVKPEEEPI